MSGGDPVTIGRIAELIFLPLIDDAEDRAFAKLADHGTAIVTRVMNDGLEGAVAAGAVDFAFDAHGEVSLGVEFHGGFKSGRAPLTFDASGSTAMRIALAVRPTILAWVEERRRAT